MRVATEGWYPTSTEDCWLVKAGDKTKYPSKKLHHNGTVNPFKTHILLFSLKRQTAIVSIGRVHAHRCSKGLPELDAPARERLSCINPWHLTLCTQRENIEHKICSQRLGAALCPHTPKCIWTNKHGKRMKCWDAETMPEGEVCRCRAGCFDPAQWRTGARPGVPSVTN